MIYYASSNTMPIEYKGYIFYVKYDAEEVEGEITNLLVHYIRLNDSPEDASALLNTDTLTALEQFIVENHLAEGSV